jgi:hypothetical protein
MTRIIWSYRSEELHLAQFKRGPSSSTPDKSHLQIMCPAGNFIDPAIAIEMMEPCIGVRLQAALEVLQMLSRMLALAVL